MLLKIAGFILGGLSFLSAHDKVQEKPLSPPLSYAEPIKSAFFEEEDNKLVNPFKHRCNGDSDKNFSSGFSPTKEEILSLKNYFNILDLMADRIFSLLSKELKGTIDARHFSPCFRPLQKVLAGQVILSFSKHGYFQILEYSTPLGSKPIALIEASPSTIVEKLKGILQLIKTTSSNHFYVAIFKTEQTVYYFPSSFSLLSVSPDPSLLLTPNSSFEKENESAEIYEALYSQEK